MKNPAAAFINFLTSKRLKLAELYIIVLRTGTTLYYTSHQKDIVWDEASNTYVHEQIQRGPINNNVNLEVDQCEIQLQNITGELFDIVQSNALDNAQITIKRIFWNQNYAPDMELVLFIGTCDVEFNRTILTLKCRSILDSLNIQVPRQIYQEPCNHTLYDTGCALIQDNYAYAGAATSDGGDNFTLNDTDLAVYKAAFDDGDSDNPIEIGDSLSGSVAGDGVCINISYVTSSTGFVWYVENTTPFINDEIITGGGNTITVNGTPAEDTSFYEQGEIEITSGNNVGEKRMVILSSNGIVTVAVAFPHEVLNTDDYKIYPGCDKRALESCRNKFNNHPLGCPIRYNSDKDKGNYKERIENKFE